MTQQGDLRYQLPTPQDSQLLADISQAITKRTQTDENPDRYSGTNVDFEANPTSSEREAIQVVVANVSLQARSTAELANSNHSMSDGNVINDGQQQELAELGDSERTTESQISVMI